MSKKRTLLVAALVILVLATIAFFTSSVMKEPVETETAKPAPSMEKSQPTEEDVLAPLPADNKAAIESEISNIEMEIDSAIETELDDLADIELSL